MNKIILPVIITSAISSVVIFLTENMPCAKIVRFLCALCICLSILLPLRMLLPELETFSESVIKQEDIPESHFENDLADSLKNALEKSAADILQYRFGVKADISAELDTADMTNIRIISLRVHFENADLLQKAECLAALRAEFLCEVTEI